MNDNIHYDGTRLLSLMDINGKKPEIYIASSNRTGGKTTYFNRFAVNGYKNKKEKFMLIYRYKYEIQDVAEKFFKDINALFFPGDRMTEKTKANGIYKELFLNDFSCGYAVCLSCADAIKKVSHELTDTSKMLFDEFQSEQNRYLPGEIEKLLSIHTSVARGRGQMVRYVPIYMISNPVSLLNPYYAALGISERLNINTRFLRGDGFVLEQNINENAKNAQNESAFNRAFSKSKYTEYAAQGIYLNDNKAFIEKPKGRSRYICTLKYNDTNFGVREFADLGIIYCDDRPDLSHPYKVSITTEDHNINYVMLKRNDMLIYALRDYFEKGCFRFKDLKSKECILKAVSYY